MYFTLSLPVSRLRLLNQGRAGMLETVGVLAAFAKCGLCFRPRVHLTGPDCLLLGDPFHMRSPPFYSLGVFSHLS